MQQPILGEIPPSHEASQQSQAPIQVPPIQVPEEDLISDLIPDLNLVPIPNLMGNIKGIKKLHEYYLNKVKAVGKFWDLQTINQKIAYEKEFVAYVRHILVDSEAILNQLQALKESKIPIPKCCCCQVT